MAWGWLIAAIVAGILSLVCIISTILELGVGKINLKKGDFWGAVAFHAVTALLALWFFLKAIGKA